MKLLVLYESTLSVLFLELAVLITWTDYIELQLWTVTDKEKFTDVNL